MLPISHRGDQVFGTVPRVQCAAQSITGRDRVRRTAAEAAAGASFRNLSPLHTKSIRVSSRPLPVLWRGEYAHLARGLSFFVNDIRFKKVIVKMLYIIA